ncbi:hypothetical protein NEOLEDRAFT_150636 [Neolentinus lepideus HHB14362 ss-1]|uniref:Uncharacterized protein n=1 Tax=Neolentinus lepideus HHB14362 ss-1 TaxID=1314782 RepID=A0A165MMS5_9AGAM|nr:hypothetical protein NEOLEDRAFT_150636 [Neolentinus lepideus HHB14362 ss-1]
MSPARVQSPGVDYIHDDLANTRCHSESRSQTPSSSSRENRPLPPPPPRPPSSRRTRTPFSNAQDHDRDHDRPPVLSNSTNRLLTRLLAREERDARKIDSIVSFTSEQLEKEAVRANEAERRALAALTQLKTLSDAKRLADSETSRLREELRLYKLQLEQAQREILRAQEIVNQVEAERKDAEAEAARQRSIARKFKEERMVEMAREEGRRKGYAEGLRRGFAAGRREGYLAGREDDDMVVYGQDDRDERDVRDADEQEEESEEMREQEVIRPPARQPTVQARPASRAASKGPGPSRGPSRTSNRTPYHDPDLAPHAPSLPVPTVTTPLRMPSPHHADPSPAPDAGLPRSPEVIHPISVYHVPATPPDGWVPSVERLDGEGDRRIHLPAPHELGGVVTMTPRSQSTRPFPSLIPQDDSFYMPPAPTHQPRTRDYAYPSGSAPVQTQYMMAPNSPPRSASRTSTRVSDFEILSAPGSRSRSQTSKAGSERERRSHTPGSERERKRSESTHRRSSSPSGPRPMRPHTPYRYEDPPPPSMYAEPPMPSTTPRPGTPGESLRGWTKTPVDRGATKTPLDRTASRTPLGWLFRRRARRADSTPPNISVEPPSGSVSSTSNGSGRLQPDLLSPEHAPQPLPMDIQMQQVPPPQSVFGHSPDGHLPPLFVPTGPVYPIPPPEETFRIPTPNVTGYYGGDVAMKDAGRERAGSDASMESAPLNRPFSVFND